MAKSIYWLAIAALLFCAACNESTIVGSDVLPPGDGVNLVQTDTLTIRSSTRIGDTVRVYDQDFRLQLGNYLCGRLEDPVFGESTSQIFSQFRLSAVSPDFEGARFDSLVLALAWDQAGLYGNLDEGQGFSVNQLSESMDATATYYSDQTFMTGSEIGRADNVIANPDDSVSVGGTLSGPQLRIKLDDALGESFMAPENFLFFENDSLMFLEFFNGLNIAPDATNDAMLSFNFESQDTKMTLYYSQFIDVDSIEIDPVSGDTTFVTDPVSGDTLQTELAIPRTFDFIVNSLAAKSTNYDHQHDQGSVQGFLDGTESGDSLIFVQSMEGLLGVVEFPFAEQFDDIIVNKAELFVTVGDFTDTSSFPLPEQLLVLEENDNGDLVLIDDVVVSLSVGSADFEVFGGNPVEDSDGGTFFTRYRLNLTSHFQNIVDGTDAPQIFLTTFPREEVASRVVFGGATNSQYGMKLILTYTKL